jgi:hypothetical protein
LQEVVARYASMTSYSDRGAVHRHLDDSGSVFSTTFSTSFKKPSLFRFEFARPHAYPPLGHIITRHSVAFDGTTAYSMTQRDTDAPKIMEKDTLATVVAGATGVSSGSAHTIARLLLPGIGGLSILDLVDAHQHGDTAIDGVACYSVAARYPKGGTVEFCIEKDELLIRKTTRTFEGDNFPAIEIRENICVNGPIDDRIFKFER